MSCDCYTYLKLNDFCFESPCNISNGVRNWGKFLKYCPTPCNIIRRSHSSPFPWTLNKNFRSHPVICITFPRNEICEWFEGNITMNWNYAQFYSDHRALEMGPVFYLYTRVLESGKIKLWQRGVLLWWLFESYRRYSLCLIVLISRWPDYWKRIRP